MNQTHFMILSFLETILTLSFWNKIRYDLVVFMALIVSVISGIVSFKSAFSDFEHQNNILVMGPGEYFLEPPGALEFFWKTLNALIAVPLLLFRMAFLDRNLFNLMCFYNPRFLHSANIRFSRLQPLQHGKFIASIKDTLRDSI